MPPRRRHHHTLLSHLCHLSSNRILEWQRVCLDTMHSLMVKTVTLENHPTFHHTSHLQLPTGISMSLIGLRLDWDGSPDHLDLFYPLLNLFEAYGHPLMIPSMITKKALP